jgi:7-carboxy-7-deazaguanine synthase
VRANAVKLGPVDIVRELLAFDDGPVKTPWVILSGGNPALHDLSELVDTLHSADYLVAVETQGSRWRDWMANVDRLCVSPKPPSSEEPKSKESQLHKFLEEGMRAKTLGNKPYEWMFLKVVCFTDEDIDYAVKIRKQLSDALLYLSAGNDAGATVGQPDRVDERGLDEVRRDLMDKAAWLAETALSRPELVAHDVFIQYQLHTALWGNGRGF